VVTDFRLGPIVHNLEFEPERSHPLNKRRFKCVEFARLRHKPECTVYTRQAYTQPVRVIVYTVYSVQRAVFVILPPTTRGWSPLVNFCEKMENGKWKMGIKHENETSSSDHRV
jgi:hypothetical protein